MSFKIKKLLVDFMAKGNVNLMPRDIMDAMDQADENKTMGFVVEVALMNFLVDKKRVEVKRVRLDVDNPAYQDYPDLIFELDGKEIVMELKSRVESQKSLKTPLTLRGGGFPTISKASQTVAQYVQKKKEQKILKDTDLLVFIDLVKLSGKIPQDFVWVGEKGKKKGKLREIERRAGESGRKFEGRILRAFYEQYRVSSTRPYWIDRISVFSIKQLEKSQAKLESRDKKGKKVYKKPVEMKQLKFKHLNLIIGEKEEANKFMLERG